MKTRMILTSMLLAGLMFTPLSAPAQTGWHETTFVLESEHLLPNGLETIYKVEAPPATQKMRIRFDSIRMEAGYDTLEILDPHGNLIERLSGTYQDYLSLPVYGSRAKIRVTTDETVQSWGFSVSSLRQRGCQPVQSPSAVLSRTPDCTALLEQIQQAVVSEIHNRFNHRSYWWGMGGPGLGLVDNGPESAPAHSETNVQVAGVDEADIVKTDGLHVYALAGRQLRMFRSYPVEHSFLHYTVDIQGTPREMFVEDERVVVISSLDPGEALPVPLEEASPWGQVGQTKISVFDTSSGAPHLAEEFFLAGRYLTSRRVDQSYRFVLNNMLRWPALQFHPQDATPGTHEYEDALDRLERQAVDTVLARGLEEWLVDSYVVRDGRREIMPLACDRFFHPQVTSARELTSVVTLDLSSRPADYQDVTLFLRSHEIHQNLDSLYLSSRFYPRCSNSNFPADGGQTTHLHKFTTTAARTDYRASGSVTGTIRDQFAMDAHQGYLRIATNNRDFGIEDPEQRQASRVYVLGEDHESLRVVGMTERLAPGETLFGTRFIGDLGFVVTFRRVDPLFTLDLSSPADPQVLGELTIPGFSTYLHPLEPGTLFAIGNDFEPDGTTRNGVALSVFDVSDLADPRRTHKAVVGTRYGQSPALDEHKAFTMYRPDPEDPAVLAIPFSDYVPGAEDYWERFQSTLKLFRVSPLGILGLGEIDMSDMFAQAGHNQFSWWYRPNVKRGVFIGGYAFAVADVGIRAVEVEDPRTVVAEVFEPVQEVLPGEEPRMAVTEKEWPRAFIPAWWWGGGLSRSLYVSADMPIEKLSVQLDIRHDARGDLFVKLEHDGHSVVLHDMEGGNNDNLIQTYHLEDFSGSARGKWTLKVYDLRPFHFGRLMEWGLTVKGKVPRVPPRPI